MRLFRAQVMMLLLLIITLAMVIALDQPSSAVSEGMLSVEGTSIVNPIGNVVILRGVNYLGYDRNVNPEVHSESTFRLFAQLGFNVVRLPISWSNLEPSPGKFRRSYLEQYVDKDVKWAKKYGLYVVLDMHQLNWGARFGGSGVPDWLIANYPPTDEGMRRATSDFWVQTEIQDHLAKVWMNVAHRYANESTIAGYDLLNEPWVYTSIIPQLNASYVNEAYLRIIRSIRTVDRNHIIFLEPSNMLPSTFSLKEKIAWSPHFYPLAFDPSYHQSSSSILETDMAAKYGKFVIQMGFPIWIGEFGAFMHDDSSSVWLGDTLRIFNKYQLGWAWWAFDARNPEIPSPLRITNEGPVRVSERDTKDLESFLPFGVALEIAVAGILAVLLAIRIDKKKRVAKRQRARGASRRSGTGKA